MSSNVVNQVAYLRTSREFPEDIHLLSQQASKSYIDIAATVNNRTIGIFPVNRPAINGENWFISKNQRLQGLRQVYTFTTTTAIDLGFDTTAIQFTKMYGTYTDGTNWYGLIAGSNTAIAGQRGFYVSGSPTNQVTFVSGAGAPAISKGLLVLEWISTT